MIILLASTIWSLDLSAQKKPNEFPVDNSPEDTDALYTQEAVAGVPTNRKFFLSTLRNFFNKNNVVTITTNTTTTNTVDVIYINASEGAVTLILPSAAANTGKQYRIIKTDTTSNLAKVQQTAGSVRGSSRAILMGQWSEITLTSNGSTYQ